MGKLTQFVNCKILRNHSIFKEDLWVRDGKIVNPEKVFFDEKVKADFVIDCKGSIIAPGFIELQINGGLGYDFSFLENTEKGVSVVSKFLLSHGVTSFCPTVVTSPKEIYHSVLPKITRRKGGKNGATIIGVHVEGPFISKAKKGAHPPEHIVTFEKGISDLEDVYGSLDNVQIITLAPELDNSSKVIQELRKRNIIVSVGHSIADLANGEVAVNNGASLITHLFNAMLPFHHRDPGLVGLLASDKIPEGRTIFFGIISDGIHTQAAALRIAYRVHAEGLILVTDAISAMGLNEGQHKIGQMDIEIRDRKAYIAGTNTLCGSIASMIQCIKIFLQATGCTPEYALEAASLHPAKLLGIEKVKGTLDFGADADFVFLNENFDVVSTWIAGECVYNVEA
ncbi:N-acetylglucosamine-6-phosphate deacetylase [Anoplophora glabripennis]|uniref:N-acetylglucosamine-6-phosphate deacetylase n=1 Tax=Anoplophora glabripennis TaxID=217634 RepID=UPI0008753012|nr:N-acetylglucosamine-6-phosphate deacetylase [Anoplophora glabripennis]